MRNRILLLPLTVGGCTTPYLQPADVTVDQVLQANAPKDMSFTLKDGRIVHIWSATIVGDSVVGVSLTYPDGKTRPRAVARADIARVSIRKVDTVGTSLVVGAAAFAAMLTGFFWYLGRECHYC